MQQQQQQEEEEQKEKDNVQNTSKISSSSLSTSPSTSPTINKKWSSMMIVPMAWMTCGLFVFILFAQHDLVSPSSSPMASPTSATTSSSSSSSLESAATEIERGGGGFVSLSSWKKRQRPKKEQQLDVQTKQQQQQQQLQQITKTETKKDKTEHALQRGKPISATITPHELYKAYTQIRDEYNTKAFHPSSTQHWQVLKSTSDGIEISMMHHPSDPSCPYVRMKAVMPGTIQETWEFLELKNWDRTMPKMDPFYEGLETLGRYSLDGTHSAQYNNNNNNARHYNTKRKDTDGIPHSTFQTNKIQMILARKRTSRILTFGKRDFTFVSVSDLPRPSDNVWVSGTVSVITSKFPRQKGYTRAFQDSVAFYQELPPDPKTNEDKTYLTIVCRIDLNDSSEEGEGGFIPMWIYSKTIGLSGVMSINNMRRELVRNKEENRKKMLLEQQQQQQKEKNDKEQLESEVNNKEETFIPLLPWVRTKS